MPFCDPKHVFEKSVGIDGGGPYSIWKAPGFSSKLHNKKEQWFCVLDRNGVNVSRSSTGDGAVFTTKRIASSLAYLWNKKY